METFECVLGLAYFFLFTLSKLYTKPKRYHETRWIFPSGTDSGSDFKKKREAEKN